MVQSAARLPPLRKHRWSWCLCTIVICVGAGFTQAYRAGPALCQHRALLQAQPPAADSNSIDGIIGPGLRAPDPAMAPAGELPPLVDRGTLDPDSGRTSVGILTLIPVGIGVLLTTCVVVGWKINAVEPGLCYRLFMPWTWSESDDRDRRQQRPAPEPELPKRVVVAPVIVLMPDQQVAYAFREDTEGKALSISQEVDDDEKLEPHPTDDVSESPASSSRHTHVFLPPASSSMSSRTSLPHASSSRTSLAASPRRRFRVPAFLRMEFQGAVERGNVMRYMEVIRPPPPAPTPAPENTVPIITVDQTEGAAGDPRRS